MGIYGTPEYYNEPDNWMRWEDENEPYIYPDEQDPDDARKEQLLEQDN